MTTIKPMNPGVGRNCAIRTKLSKASIDIDRIAEMNFRVRREANLVNSLVRTEWELPGQKCRSNANWERRV